ncbi:MAG: hypothetical protein J4G05_12300 [Chlorobi bacterium]|nr:hypothetical protein [Chlorobiota bacterium]
MIDLWPPLAGNDWIPTRDALHDYLQIIGEIRTQLAPRQKHWWHVGLLPSLNGVSTGRLRQNEKSFAIEADLQNSRVILSFQDEDPLHISLNGQSSRALWSQMHDVVSGRGIQLEIGDLGTNTVELTGYSPEQARALGNGLNSITWIFETFKGEQRKETGPITLWPHHFDLALLWFSGRLVEGADPDDEEKADEQMNFGFATGDRAISEPYVYITAYPLPERLSDTPLPEGAYWHTEGWQGAVMPYASLIQTADPGEHLLGFMRRLIEAGQELMGL